MSTYALLLDEISPYLDAKFSEIPKDLQKRLSQAGLGEVIKEIFEGTEEYDLTYIEAENKYLTDEEARAIEDGEGIIKSKGIRTKIETQKFYLWDTLSPLQREYKLARYDFDNTPGFRENAALEKLVESIKTYLETPFQDLPQDIKMKIAFVDQFQLWNEISTEQREYLAHSFDAMMQPDYEKTVNKYCAMYLELQAIPDEKLHWLTLNSNRVASEERIIREEIKKLEERESELEKLLGYSDSDMEQEPLIMQEVIRRTDEMRAFINNCCKNGIERNIASIWLHIHENANKPGFLFKSAGKGTATSINDKEIKRENLAKYLT